ADHREIEHPPAQLIMAFIFTMRSTTVISSSASAHSRNTSAEDRLATILENGNAPPVPPRAANRPSPKRHLLGNSSRHNSDQSPSPYTTYATAVGPAGEKFTNFRNNRHIAQRGVWKRLCIIITVVLVVIVALIIGMVMGLRKKHARYANYLTLVKRTSLCD